MESPSNPAPPTFNASRRLSRVEWKLGQAWEGIV